MLINVYVGQPPSQTLIASGELDIDAETFTPTGGTSIPLSSISWSTDDNGVTDFSFNVSGQANGAFPCGAGGAAFPYNFIGTENATATEANGTVPFPDDAVSIKDGGGDPPVWQSDSTEGKPVSRGAGAAQ